jgi:CheY-like chemotaxis protein
VVHCADNPINQTILTTFMRRKKIKFDVAENGEKAVAKWKSGKFHLILVCIPFAFRIFLILTYTHTHAPDGYSNACDGWNCCDN